MQEYDDNIIKTSAFDEAWRKNRAVARIEQAVQTLHDHWPKKDDSDLSLCFEEVERELTRIHRGLAND